MGIVWLVVHVNSAKSSEVVVLVVVLLGLGRDGSEWVSIVPLMVAGGLCGLVELGGACA